MRHAMLAAWAVLMGCATTPISTANARGPGTEPAETRVQDRAASEPKEAVRDGAWLGAAAESDLMLAGTTETNLGVWIDAPAARARVHLPTDLALVIDTSGSMAGEKIENARRAAGALVERLRDGDIVSIDTFSDDARVLVPPTTLNASTRERVLSMLQQLGPTGSTNMFAGLGLGEAHLATAPASHAVRRVVVISDGIANVGPSSPDALGALAERGLRHHAQVTSLGVGIDYDEHTLNALAMRTNGRLYHLSEPREMTHILAKEMELLESTVASDASLEIVPAAGVEVLAADGIRANRGEAGSVRIPLGALFAGQHREALVRVRVTPSMFPRASETRPLASVRLRFRDPADGDIERLQEVVARAGVTSDPTAVASHANARTQSIAAMQQAAKLEMAASQSVNGGNFDDADHELAAAESALRAQAQATTDASERQRLTAAASSVGSTRSSARAAAAAPKAVQRDEALKMNHSGMSVLGY